MNENQNKKINDCKGTCKTIIGCTCKEVKLKDTVMVDQDNFEIKETSKKIIIVDTEKKACCGKNKAKYGSNKLDVFNYLENFPNMYMNMNIVEVQFKNTRKEYFNNSNNIELHKGDIVVVEANPGSDIGEVTLTGKLVELQIKKTGYKSEIRRLYRIAKPNDLAKYELVKSKEHATMLRAREIAEELKVEMKISDVEFQGDGNKAIFYYIADGRVDFRQLIKHYASEFKIKIEMKQIGARQEAGRVGGIGPCGRELCCSSSLSNFISVSTSVARIQDIPLNPQKMAGQCGKLKCCMNYEVDVYVEAQRKIPAQDIELHTKDATYYFFKADILGGMISYSTAKNIPANIINISSKRAFDIIRMNKKGEKPDSLDLDESVKTSVAKNNDLLASESITRFDNQTKKKNNNRKKDRDKNNKISQGDNERNSQIKNNTNKTINKNNLNKRKKLNKRNDNNKTSNNE